MEEISLKEFWNYYKRYLIFVIISVVLCAFLMFNYSQWFKEPMYSTSTTIILVNNTDNGSTENVIDQNDITLNQKLVSTYRQLFKSRLVVGQVIDALNLDYSIDELSKRITVEAVDDTSILKITVLDSNPEMAADIANELTYVFKIEVSKIYENINNVSVIDAAEVNEIPSNISTTKDTIIAALVGFVISSLIIFVIFYFDDVLRNPDELEKIIDLPVLAKVYKDNGKTDLIVDTKPNAPASESIRNLRTNLQFSSIDEELKIILVTSTTSNDGKSFISANLATSFAQSGKKVLLIDCDLRKGRQHKIFGVSGHKGLSNLLIGDIGSYSDYIVKTRVKNLYFMPRGTFPPNPSELLNSKKNVTLLEILKNRFDLIILDGVPITGLSDSLILSSLVDKTILISSINHTPKTDLIAAKKSLESVGANIAGTVANKVDTKYGSNGGYYYYGSQQSEISELEKETTE